MSDFFKTRMGQRYYEHTMPEIAEQLERLNDLLERLVRAIEAHDDDATRRR